MSSLQERNQVKLQSPYTVFQMFETPFKQFGKDVEFVEGNWKEIVVLEQKC